MEQEITITEKSNTNKLEKLLPEIAEVLNITVSELEQYPDDMKSIICQAYINNSNLGKDNIADTINGIINLDTDKIGLSTSQKQDNNISLDNEVSEKEKTSRTNKRSFLITRSQLLRNAKTIESKNSQRTIQHQEELTLKNSN